MAKNEDYVPGKIAIFNEWQQNLVSMVSANVPAWQITAAKMDQLSIAQAAYQPLYNAIVNKATRTPQQVAAHKVGHKTYVSFLRTFVKENLIANPLIPYDDKLALGLNPGDGVRHSRPVITTAPVVEVKALGGDRVQFICRVEGDDNRPSIQADADGVELRYKFDTPAPANYSEANLLHFSTKARFTINLRPELAGKTMYVFARWKNNTDESKSGPWCGIASVIVR